MGDYFSRALRYSEDDEPQLIEAQSPIVRPAPIVRPGEERAAPRVPRPLPRPLPRDTQPVEAPPAPSPAAPATSTQPTGTPQDVYLPPEEFEKLPDQDKAAYLKQRNDWFDFKQQMGRFAPQGVTPPPSSNAAEPRMAIPPPIGPEQLEKTPASPQVDYFGRAIRGQQGGPAQISQATPNPNAEPDAESWLGRRWQDIRGKQDQRYKGLPAIAEVLLKEGKLGPGTGLGSEQLGWLSGVNDKDMGGIYGGILGDRFIRQEEDANGFPIVVYRDQAGKEARAYVNKPGIDMQDVVRGTVGVAPYFGAGKIARAFMPGAKLVPRVAGQAAAMGATSVAQDATAAATGISDLDLEQTAIKAAASAAGGAGGELLGSAGGYLWRKLVAEPKYFNRATGTLTQLGEQAVRDAGLDPMILTRGAARDFGRAMARTGDPAAATRQVANNEFKIPRTQGELTGDMDQLLREQQIYGGAYGRGPSQGMKAFREQQTKAVGDAVAEIGGEIAPGRAGAQMAKNEAGSAIQANTAAALEKAKQFERDAWNKVPELVAESGYPYTNGAMDTLGRSMKRGLEARKIDFIEEGLTPSAKKMSDMLGSFEKGEMPVPGSAYVGGPKPGNIDLMRRRLLAETQNATTNTDKRAARAIYDSFNDWIDEAAKMTGDPAASAGLRTARALTKQIHEAFDGQQGTAGARILGKVLKTADSAEEIVNALFSAPVRSDIKTGAISALRSLKEGYTRFLEPEAANAAWNDVRLAYWNRLVSNRAGEVPGPAQLASSIKNAIGSQQTMMKELFSPAEIGRMQRLASILDDVKKKNPNTSWSGVSVGNLMKDVGDAMLSMIGANTVLGRAAVRSVGTLTRSAAGEAQLSAATGAGRGAVVPSLPPPTWTGGLGGGIASERSK